MDDAAANSGENIEAEAFQRVELSRQGCDYGLEVKASPALTKPLSIDRAYSFRYELADAWFELTHPEESTTPMSVTFASTRQDFAPNLDNLKVQHVVLHFDGDDPKDDIPVGLLSLTPFGGDGPVGGGTLAKEGLASTRSGAGAWQTMIGSSPMGTWKLTLPDTPAMRAKFRTGEITDVLLVVTYAGHPPEWPQ